MPIRRAAARLPSRLPTSGEGSSASSSSRSRVSVEARSASSSTARCSSRDRANGGETGGASREDPGAGLLRLVDHHRAGGEVAEALEVAVGEHRHQPDAVEERQEIHRAQQVAGQRRRPAHRRAVVVQDGDAEGALARRLPVPAGLEPGRQQPFDEEGGDEGDAGARGAERPGDHHARRTPRRRAAGNRPTRRARAARARRAAASVRCLQVSLLDGWCRASVPPREPILGAYPRRIESKNSAFDLVAFSLSMRNSAASSSSIGKRSLRSTHTFCSTGASISSSSRRVPERLTLIAG